MSDYRTFVVTIAALLLLVSVSRAQDCVSFPSGDAAWTVDISPAAPKTSTEAAAGHQVHLTHVEVTEVNKTKRVRLTWSDGKISEKWNIAGLPVTFNQDPNSGQVRPHQNGSLMEEATNAGFSYDAFAFTWLNASFLQEKTPVSYQGKECFHYVGWVTPPLSNSANPPHLKREAWIDAKTLLPVALMTDESTSAFTFQEKAPTEALTPPADFAKEIAYYKAVMGVR